MWLCDPMDCSPPGSYVHGILQARILKWVAISYSRATPRPRDQSWLSCIIGRFLPSESPEKLAGFFTTSATWEAPQRSNYITITFWLLFPLIALWSTRVFSHYILWHIVDTRLMYVECWMNELILSCRACHSSFPTPDAHLAQFHFPRILFSGVQCRNWSGVHLAPTEPSLDTILGMDTWLSHDEIVPYFCDPQQIWSQE